MFVQLVNTNYCHKAKNHDLPVAVGVGVGVGDTSENKPRLFFCVVILKNISLSR